MNTNLADFVDLQRGNTYKSALLGQAGPVLLGLGTIERNGGFRGDNLKTYSGPSDPRMILRPGDLYVSLKDVTQSADLLGAVAMLPDSISLGRLTQDTVKLVFKDKDAPRTYIYWLLRTPQYRAYCRAHATGTTNLGLARDDFLAFPVPPLDDRRTCLVELIQGLDDKIELNRRMNETLEAMAQAIFRDWFVDFGPTRRKLEGAADPITIMGGLVQDTERAQALADLFPATLGDDGLPEGWKLGRLEGIVELAYGKSLPKGDRRKGDVPVYGSGGIGGFHDHALVQGPSVIIGRKGTVGSLFWEDRPFYPIDTVFFVKTNFPMTYCYYLLQTLGLETMNTDAAVPGLNRNNAYRLEVAMFDEALILEFGKVAGLIRSKISANEIESRTLAATRDLLLPKLMSGETRLSVAVEVAA